jgi:glycosyltransferase involved in cell wall biosynthesis
MNNVGILWAQYGPYHFARVAALKRRAGLVKIFAFELANQTADYEWKRSVAVDLITLCPGEVAEQLSFWKVFHRTRRVLTKLKIDVCILPSYAPKQSLAAFLAAKSLGLRTVMMNESHAGTARAGGAAAWIKRRLVKAFDSALVGGIPQKRYFASLGLPEEKIFTGYDAVDNEYFSQRAAVIKSQAAEFRGRYDLPSHYFLSLGRFVAKKNLSVLIQAYRKFVDAGEGSQTHLVMVGSGEEESKLRALCTELRLPVYQKTEAGSHADILKAEDHGPGVHFYGFRQIEENPIFYALADAFILPSLWEEWGLVVNEAMACGLPVIVSKTAGCAEDLLKPGQPAGIENLKDEASQRILDGKIGDGVCQNGFVFDPEACEALTAALTVLVSVPGLRDKMGENSRKVVAAYSCDYFAWNALRAASVAMGENPANLPGISAAEELMVLDSKLLS